MRNQSTVRSRRRHPRRTAPRAVLPFVNPLCGVLLAVSLAATPRPAEADGYYREDGRTVRHPDRYVLVPAPPPQPPPPVVIEVPAVLVPPTTTPPPVIVRPRDPYETDGIVVAGGGLGGLLLHADGGTAITPAYLLHLGLAVGAAEFALRLNLAPHATTLPGSDREVAIYATRASFDYRFLHRAVVHPVAGVGLESIVSVPDGGEAGHAFAAVGRAGLELAFPLEHAALALGIDASGHLPFGRSEAFALDLDAMLGFGAYLDYRF